jgi:DNA-binding XRE family transcriptional regulator
MRQQRIPHGKDRRMVDEVSKNLKRWTTGEHFWLARMDDGITQAEAARLEGISEKRYGLIETDRTEPNSGRPLPRPYTVGQLCALARRRHGLSLRATAKLMGVSHVTILLWERDSEPRLAAGWRHLGYRF